MKAKLLAALALLVCAPAHAGDTVWIDHDKGGLLDDYATKYAALRDAGTKVVIDGECTSACTMVTRLPHERVCITPNAVMGFHSASTEKHHYTMIGTRWLTWGYPRGLRAILRRHGWDSASAHPDLIYIDADELRTVFRPC